MAHATRLIAQNAAAYGRPNVANDIHCAQCTHATNSVATPAKSQRARARATNSGPGTAATMALVASEEESDLVADAADKEVDEEAKAADDEEASAHGSPRLPDHARRAATSISAPKKTAWRGSHGNHNHSVLEK